MSAPILRPWRPNVRLGGEIMGRAPSWPIYMRPGQPSIQRGNDDDDGGGGGGIGAFLFVEIAGADVGTLLPDHGWTWWLESPGQITNHLPWAVSVLEKEREPLVLVEKISRSEDPLPPPPPPNLGARRTVDDGLLDRSIDGVPSASETVVERRRIPQLSPSTGEASAGSILDERIGQRASEGSAAVELGAASMAPSGSPSASFFGRRSLVRKAAGQKVPQHREEPVGGGGGISQPEPWLRSWLAAALEAARKEMGEIWRKKEGEEDQEAESSPARKEGNQASDPFSSQVFFAVHGKPPPGM
ncbi:hypothetical protein MKZ38_008261 [Zalerion maritima]|uniref:Uncharacterized protein n=1 Tax=Zalerion maritima TaxID=339359 RepID=A0AAD5RUE6_9PEZI|nr:hypothetical protein MKZ38_008261 [Zalerion maritima]